MHGATNIKTNIMFIAFLYMFRATMCPSSGENTVPMQHLVFVTLYMWYAGRNEFRHAYQTVIHIYRVTNTRCRIGTVFSPDDGHIVARNMQRNAINTLKICAPSRFYFKTIQGCTINRT